MTQLASTPAADSPEILRVRVVHRDEGVVLLTTDDVLKQAARAM